MVAAPENKIDICSAVHWLSYRACGATIGVVPPSVSDRKALREYFGRPRPRRDSCSPRGLRRNRTTRRPARRPKRRDTRCICNAACAANCSNHTPSDDRATYVYGEKQRHLSIRSPDPRTKAESLDLHIIPESRARSERKGSDRYRHAPQSVGSKPAIHRERCRYQRV